jgi:hypothetical protein
LFDPQTQTGAVFPGQVDPITNAIVPSNEIVLHFIQGKRGDDKVADNVIVDAGGPATFGPAAAVTGPADGLRGQSRTFTVSATSLSAAAAAAGFTYTIDWGDGSPVQTVAATPGNGSGVPVSHAFLKAGPFTVRVTATDSQGLASAPASVSLMVNNPSVTVTGGFTVSATAGSDSGLQTVATFVDPAGPGPLTGYSADILWGDGRTSPGAIAFDPGTGVFTVQGSHKYGEKGATRSPSPSITTSPRTARRAARPPSPAARPCPPGAWSP